jgi:hypothetical protein
MRVFCFIYISVLIWLKQWTESTQLYAFHVNVLWNGARTFIYESCILYYILLYAWYIRLHESLLHYYHIELLCYVLWSCIRIRALGLLYYNMCICKKCSRIKRITNSKILFYKLKSRRKLIFSERRRRVLFTFQQFLSPKLSTDCLKSWHRFSFFALEQKTQQRHKGKFCVHIS